MARYLALATIVVAMVLGAILALPRGGRDAAQSVFHSRSGATPGPPTRGSESRDGRALPVTGDAPWALSALPDCFHQKGMVSGSEAFVLRRLPTNARRVANDTILETGDCRLRVGYDDGMVSRAENVLHIPAPARFFVSGKRLILFTQSGRRSILRMYLLASGRYLNFKEMRTPNARTKPR